MQKLGWSAGTGLGASGDGRTTHIKVQQKLDMLGIGAAHQRDPNGLAWKQNKDFENLLRRLNAGGEGDVEVEMSKIDGFAKATEVKEEDVIVEEETKEDKKRKRDKGEDGVEGKKKKSKKTKDEDGDEGKKKKKSKDKSKKSEEEELTKEPSQDREPSPEPVKRTVVVARP